MTTRLLTPILALLTAQMLSASEPITSHEAGWPGFSGPLGNFQAIPPASPLLDNLSLAPLVWESEARHFGAGKAGGVKRETRQDLLNSFGKDRIRWAGSLTGPIVAHGTVYVASFRPAGDWVEFKGKAGRKHQEIFDEPIQLQVEAEDTLTALDMETGETRWTFATPGGLCWTQGKRGGLQIAPAYADGSVYFVGTQGTIYAVDAATGEERWRSDIGWAAEQMKLEKQMYLNGPDPAWDKRTLRKVKTVTSIVDGMYRSPHTPTWHGGIRVIGDTVVSNDSGTGLVAFDAETGSKKWQKGGINSYMAAPSVWTHEGKSYLLVATGPGGKSPPMGKTGMLRLLNPEDGREIWAESIGHTYPTLAPFGNRVLVNIRIPKDKEELNDGLLACYELSLEGAKRLWTLPDNPQYYIPLKKDALGKVRFTLNEDRAFIRTHGKKKVEAPRFLIVDAATGRILQEQQGGGKLALPNARMWYVQGDRIYATWDRHHSPNRGGRKPVSQVKWTDQSLELQRDASGPWALDLAHITGGYEVTMEHPIVDGRMFERTTAGSVVCYDLRKQADEQVIQLNLEEAWRGVRMPIPLSLRVRDGRLQTGAVFPSTGREVGQVYTTSRTTDFWRDVPVESLKLSDQGLSGSVHLDVVGEALPTTYIGLELKLARQGDAFEGTWHRNVPAKDGYAEQTGPLTGGVDAEYRSTPTPWIAPDARHRYHKLEEGQRCITLTLMGAMPPRSKGERPLLSLNLVHDGKTFVAGSGGAFRFSQGWHEVEASDLRLNGNLLQGTATVIAHGDNFRTSARGEENGPLAGRITLNAVLENGKFTGEYTVKWGIPYTAEGTVTGSIGPLP